MQRPDAVVAVCVDMGRSIIDLRERADRQDFDVLLLDLARAVARKVIDCKIVACVLERVGHGLARPCVLIVIGCRIRVDFERILDVNRLRSDTNRGAREIVLERIRGALPVVLDRTRTIVGFRRTCGIKGRSDPVGRMIRIDRERRPPHDSSLPYCCALRDRSVHCQSRCTSLPYPAHCGAHRG